MKALIVKSDGLIYAAEVPEEPKHPKYHKALASAKESAVLCADQEKAKEIIKEKFGHDLDQMNINTSGYEYPIPDLQWEVKEKHEILRYTSIVTGDLVPHVVYRQVAILKETLSDHIADVGKMVTPSTEQLKDIDVTQKESQGDADGFSPIDHICRVGCQAWYYKRELKQLGEKVIKIIDKYWGFNDQQQHTHTWHDKQDCLEEIRKLTRNSDNKSNYEN